jgi:membrane fusion protein (multidrug efflux system)
MRSANWSTLAAAAIALAFVLFSAGCGEEAQTAVPREPPPPPEVAVQVIEPQSVAITTDLPGRISSYLVAEVRPQAAGIIQKRFFTEGADVRAGEVLYQIDPDIYEAAESSAKAALNKAQANLDPARLKAQRYKEAVAIHAVSQQESDDASAALKQAEAEVQAAKASLERAQIDLAHTRVTAPISGRIGRSSVSVGALVTAGQPAPLATIQQLDPVYVDLTQSSASLLRLRRTFQKGRLHKDGAKEARVKLELEDGTPYPHDGSLKFSDVTVDQSTGSVTLRTVFPNPKLMLLPGMYVRAVLQEGIDEHALLVPQQGVARDSAGNPTALAVGPDESVELRTLQVSRAIGDQWLVEKGLQPGDRVIVEGVQKVKPGMPVRAVPFQPAARNKSQPAGS